MGLIVLGFARRQAVLLCKGFTRKRDNGTDFVSFFARLVDIMPCGVFPNVATFVLWGQLSVNDAKVSYKWFYLDRLNSLNRLSIGF